MVRSSSLSYPYLTFHRGVYQAIRTWKRTCSNTSAWWGPRLCVTQKDGCTAVCQSLRVYKPPAVAPPCVKVSPVYLPDYLSLGIFLRDIVLACFLDQEAQ